MSDLIQEFDGRTIQGWEEWYLEKNPQAIENATAKILLMVENFKEAINVV